MGIRVVKLPDVGEGVAEAEIVEWHVVVGDEVVEDQILAAVMTDKGDGRDPLAVAGTYRRNRTRRRFVAGSRRKAGRDRDRRRRLP